jgi:DNA repair exonuclease SbcCD ATPase subunit
VRVPITSSPCDPLFNPELFLEKMVEISGDGARFGSTSTDELLKLSLGHELKGLLLNYALALRQKQEVSSANEKMKVINQELDDMEKKVKSTQDKFVVDMEAAHKESKKALEDLEKDHKAAIQKLKEEHAKEVKALKEASSSRDAQLEDLIKEKGAWAEEQATLEETIGSQYDEGFNFALDQLKVLFPDIDAECLGEASVLMVIKDGALVPYELPADDAP